MKDYLSCLLRLVPSLPRFIITLLLFFNLDLAISSGEDQILYMLYVLISTLLTFFPPGRPTLFLAITYAGGRRFQHGVPSSNQRIIQISSRSHETYSHQSRR